MNNFSKKYLNLFISMRSLLIVLICTCFYGCVQQPMRNNDLIKDQLNKKVEKSFSQKKMSEEIWKENYFTISIIHRKAVPTLKAFTEI